MNVLVVTYGSMIAVLENPGVISKQAVILAWAKSQGCEKIPTGIKVNEATVTPLAKSLYGIMPYSELNQLEQEANPEQPVKHG